MKGDALKLAAQAAKITNVGAALGVIRAGNSQLDIAAQAVNEVPRGAALKDPLAAGLAFITGQTQDVVASLGNSIAQARTDLSRYAAFYVGYTDDDLDQEISTAHSMGIAAALSFVNKVLNQCIDEIGDGPTISAIDLVGAVVAVLQNVADAAGAAATHVVQGAANVAAAAVSAFWVPLAVVGGALVLFFAWDRGLLKRIAR